MVPTRLVQQEDSSTRVLLKQIAGNGPSCYCPTVELGAIEPARVVKGVGVYGHYHIGSKQPSSQLDQSKHVHSVDRVDTRAQARTAGPIEVCNSLGQTPNLSGNLPKTAPSHSFQVIQQTKTKNQLPTTRHHHHMLE